MIKTLINFIFGPINKVQKIVDQSYLHIFLTFPFLMIYFLAARQLFGLHSIFVILLVIMLFVARYSVEAITFVFFFLAILTYIIGPDVEANYYMSFVYSFLVLSILKYTYVIITEKSFKTSNN